MSGIVKLEDDMVCSTVSPYEVLEIKQTINKIIEKLDELCKAEYERGPNCQT